MKKLSFWALLNPVKAQFLILFSQLLLGILTFYSGVWLFAHNIIVPISVAHFGVVLFLVALVCYPIRRAKYKFWKISYVKQKTMDAALVLSFVLMNIQISNNEALLACVEHNQAPKAVKVVMRERPKSVVAEPIETVPQDTWSIENLSENLYEKLKKEVKAMKVQDENHTETVLATIAILVLMVLLGFLAIGFSCSIDCNGVVSHSTSLIIFGVLSSFIITGGIAWIRHIWLKRKKNYVPMPKS